MSQPSVAELFGEKTEAPATPDLTLLAMKVLELREDKKAIDNALKKINKEVEDAEVAMLNALALANLKSIKLDSGEKLTSVINHLYSLPPTDEPEARARALKWLKRVGAANLVKLDIHASSLRAFCRERMEDGKPISPDLKDFERKTLSVTKGG